MKKFKQGLFAAPATANPTHNPLVTLSGYGRTTGLPYDAYSPGPADFAPMWMDPHTSGMSLGSNTEVAHVSWYIDEGRRYSSGRWPKNLVWFDTSNSIHALDGLPASATLPEAAAPCAQGQCPSTGATEPTVGTPSTVGLHRQGFAQRHDVVTTPGRRAWRSSSRGSWPSPRRRRA